MIRLLLAVLLCLPAAARAETRHYHADMNGGMAVPCTNSAGSGSADVSLDTTRHTLTAVLNFTALAGPVRFAQIRGPAPQGRSGGVVARLGHATASPSTATLHLSARQADLLDRGLLYVVLRTTAYPEGEVRGQLLPSP